MSLSNVEATRPQRGLRGLVGLTLVVLAGVLLATTMALLATHTSAEATTSPLSGKKVVIDAGHGGTDWGARNQAYGLVEKDQNLDVARKLKSLLQTSGATVYMTRTADVNLSNTERANRANSFKAEDPGIYVLVSIHMNGSTDQTVDYTTTLFGKWQKDKALAQTVYYDGLLPSLGIKGRAPYSYASGVLLKSNMPATIAETVFITSTYEGDLLKNGGGTRQQQIAQALKVGLENYFLKYPNG
jgi:N-acetylmuramoyl-L-alanine amidase